VLELSALEGTGLERADIDAWLATLAGLNPEGKTSMLQDVEAGRRTEVDLFAGTVLEIARTHQVPVPVNETLYRIIRALESV
jgi:2-dehydropantoate 2-reductase